MLNTKTINKILGVFSENTHNIKTRTNITMQTNKNVVILPYLYSNTITQTNLEKEEYNNILYYPVSSKEWFSSVYSFSKSYIKSLVATNLVVNGVFKMYFTMLEYNNKMHLKRRRTNKVRYSANKIYVSKAEAKHTNTKVIFILYTFNKQKSIIQRLLRPLFNPLNQRIFFVNLKEKENAQVIPENKDISIKSIDQIHNTVGDKQENFLVKSCNSKNVYEKKEVEQEKLRGMNYISTEECNYFALQSESNLFTNQLDSIASIIYTIKTTTKNLSEKLYQYRNSMWKYLFGFLKFYFSYIKLINFNLLKFNNSMLKWKSKGVHRLLVKIYNKTIQIRIVQLKSIHLNSDILSEAVALKLRDRKNQAYKLLTKIVHTQVKIPDLHTLITFDDRKNIINKNNVLHVINQQIVTGIRLEASGRLTRRLTALRAVYKYRYEGSLQNIRSSFNNKASALLRGCARSNSQYTIINSKTRNGTFGLKGWVSSHGVIFLAVIHCGAIFGTSILDSLHYFVSTLLYFDVISCDAPNVWYIYSHDYGFRFGNSQHSFILDFSDTVRFIDSWRDIWNSLSTKLQNIQWVNQNSSRGLLRTLENPNYTITPLHRIFNNIVQNPNIVNSLPDINDAAYRWPRIHWFAPYLGQVITLITFVLGGLSPQIIRYCSGLYYDPVRDTTTNTSTAAGSTSTYTSNTTSQKGKAPMGSGDGSGEDPDDNDKGNPIRSHYFNDISALERFINRLHEIFEAITDYQNKHNARNHSITWIDFVNFNNIETNKPISQEWSTNLNKAVRDPSLKEGGNYGLLWDLISLYLSRVPAEERSQARRQTEVRLNAYDNRNDTESYNTRYTRLTTFIQWLISELEAWKRDSNR